MKTRVRRFVLTALPAIVIAAFMLAQPAAQAGAYYPPAGSWMHKKPAEVGMDPAKLADAIAFMKAHETNVARDFSDQEIIFGRLLGSMPTERAGTNALIIRHGYIVGEFGDTTRPDPTYSAAKSMLSTIAGISLQRGLIPGLDEPVANVIHDGGYDSPHNKAITWRNHLQQESEWEGTMFGKPSTFVGHEEFGKGEMKPRAIHQPGTYYEYNDVRINRFSLSLLRLWKKQIPDVWRDEVMNPIGASDTWKWVPYANAYVDVDGKRMASVAGGTRWGGGMWISSYDMARIGLLWLHRGKWGDKQIVPESYMKLAVTPSAHGPDYGFLFWLNTQGKHWPGVPTTAFAAEGAGGNVIFVAPDQDLVVVWRWNGAAAEGFKRVIAAINSTS